jgi:uncharacterized protein
MKGYLPTDYDRLAIRERPAGQPIMHQNWGKLLFMHWPIKEELLRPLIPERLIIDTFDGTAWISLVPFTMWDIRALPPYLPAIPGLDQMHELNVRTYVHLDGVPGVWFFSLDCNSGAAVLAARTFFFLPYFNANMTLDQREKIIDYNSSRTDSPTAQFTATWQIGEPVPTSQAGSLEFFLTERFCLYTQHESEIYHCRVHHQPWPLQSATIKSFSSTMLQAIGLTHPTDTPLVHYAEEVNVDIWLLEKQLPANMRPRS